MRRRHRSSLRCATINASTDSDDPCLRETNVARGEPKTVQKRGEVHLASNPARLNAKRCHLQSRFEPLDNMSFNASPAKTSKTRQDPSRKTATATQCLNVRPQLRLISDRLLHRTLEFPV